MSEGSPLYPLLNEINKAAQNDMPLIAIAVTVALPDICVSLISENGRSNGLLYKAWCKDNLPPEYFSYVTPDDLYSIRCGVLHNGRFGDLKHEVGRVIFGLPNSSAQFVNNIFNDAYVYSANEFCLNFTNAVYRWFEANRDNAILQSNLPRLMQYRPEGLSPYIVGMPVLA